MKIYLVGGAVRDELLGMPTQDRDWLVVGSTPQAMIDAGFKPVGSDFPVFLHPSTHEEYALARTERKTARGYHGFVFHADESVTLEQDLARRDLTINAMAKDGEVILDPFGGQLDLRQRVLRHVSPAFSEDPVRILRVARFAAQLGRADKPFQVAAETMLLMQHMVQSGEADALVPERVWQELARGLMQPMPSRMFAVLRASGLLKKILPELDRLWGVPQRADYHPEIDTGRHVMLVLDMAATLAAPLAVRVAALFHDLGKGTTAPAVLPKHTGHEMRSLALLRGICQRLRVPSDCRELSEVVAREHGNIHRSANLSASATLRLLERCDALRRPERFSLIVQACECDARGRLGFESVSYRVAQVLQSALHAALSVATQPIAQETQQRLGSAKDVGEKIALAIAQARCQAIQAVFVREATPSSHA